MSYYSPSASTARQPRPPAQLGRWTAQPGPASTSRELVLANSADSESPADFQSTLKPALTDAQEFNSGHLIVQKMQMMLEGRLYTDITFIVEGAKIQAHKCVLASWSGPLAEFFDPRKNTKGVAAKEVAIEGISAEVFRCFLNFLYTGRITGVDLPKAIQLLRVSRQFEVDELSQLCGESILSRVNVDNCCEILNATGDLNSHLRERLIQYIANSLDIVGRTVSWLSLDISAVLQILERDDIYAPNEMMVYEAGMHWVKAQEDRYAYMDQVLCLIRFPFLSKEFLADQVQQDYQVMSASCTKDLLLEAFQSMSLPNRSPARDAASARRLRKRQYGAVRQSQQERSREVSAFLNDPSHSVTTGFAGLAVSQQKTTGSMYASRKIDPMRKAEQETRTRAHDAFASALLSQSTEPPKPRYR